jgi:hypothetical protein
MRQSCVHWCGVTLVAFPLVMLPARSVVPSYLGGTAYINGYVQDGRHIVDGHGRYSVARHRLRAEAVPEPPDHLDFLTKTSVSAPGAPNNS